MGIWVKQMLIGGSAKKPPSLVPFLASDWKSEVSGGGNDWSKITSDLLECSCLGWAYGGASVTMTQIDHYLDTSTFDLITLTVSYLRAESYDKRAVVAVYLDHSNDLGTWEATIGRGSYRDNPGTITFVPNKAYKYARLRFYCNAIGTDQWDEYNNSVTNIKVSNIEFT